MSHIENLEKLLEKEKITKLISNKKHNIIVDELKSSHSKIKQKLKVEIDKVKTTNREKQELLDENQKLNKSISSQQHVKVKLDDLTKLHDRLSCKQYKKTRSLRISLV